MPGSSFIVWLTTAAHPRRWYRIVAVAMPPSGAAGVRRSLLYGGVLYFPSLISVSQIGNDSIEILSAYPVRHSQCRRSGSRSEDENFRPLSHTNLANLCVAESAHRSLMHRGRACSRVAGRKIHIYV